MGELRNLAVVVDEIIMVLTDEPSYENCVQRLRHIEESVRFMTPDVQMTTKQWGEVGKVLREELGNREEDIAGDPVKSKVRDLYLRRTR